MNIDHHKGKKVYLKFIIILNKALQKSSKNLRSKEQLFLFLLDLCLFVNYDALLP
jgi:hypothetical protein